MDVAVRGDPGCCTSKQLAPGVYLLAVANGFGSVHGQPVAPYVLTRLRADFERRARNDRLRRAACKPKNITAALLTSISKINEDLHALSGSDEDYVGGGCSLTAILSIDDRAYVAHVGSTAAYLAREAYVVGLTKSDAFDSEKEIPILTRALGLQSLVEVGICAFSMVDGDSLVLSGHRIADLQARKRLARSSGLYDEGIVSGDVLVVRYSDCEQTQVPPEAGTQNVPSILTGVLAVLIFFALAIIR